MNLSVELERRARHLAPHLRPVLRGVVAGKRNRTIAGETGLAVHTVENYMSEILSEFACESRAELIVRLGPVCAEIFTD